MPPEILKILGQGGMAVPQCRTVSHPGMYLGWHVPPGILKIHVLGQGGMAVPQYCTVSHPGTYLGWHVLPGILKILGQGSMAVP